MLACEGREDAMCSERRDDAPHTLFEAVDQHRGGCKFETAIDQFLDEFYMAGADDRRSMIDEEPALMGNPHLDAYVGAMGEHLAQRWRLGHIPSWTLAKERFLGRPWFVGVGPPKLQHYQLVHSPIAFRRRAIFTEAEPLRRPGMPRDSLAIANEEIWAECFGPQSPEFVAKVVVEDILWFR
jgi:hypothetical protein